jgi:hypothetical protein
VPKSRAAGRSEIAAVFEPDRPHARVIDRFEIITRAVGRAIIDDNEFEVCARAESTALRSNGRRFQVGRMMETSGVLTAGSLLDSHDDSRCGLRSVRQVEFRPSFVSRLPTPCAARTGCPSAAPSGSAR